MRFAIAEIRSGHNSTDPRVRMYHGSLLRVETNDAEVVPLIGPVALKKSK